MNVQNVKIKDIVVTQNSRIDMKDLAELMESIKQHGLLHPIHVGKGVGEKYIFESGRRRLLACEKLGHQTIPAVVSEEKKYKDLIIANLVENVQRKDLTVTELGRICTDLKGQSMNDKEIAVALGMSLNKVQTALEAYDRVPVRFRKKVSFLDKRHSASKGNISASAASNLLAIRRKYKLSKDEFENLFEKAIEQSFSGQDCRTIAGLLETGLTLPQAVKEKDNFKDYSVIVTLNEDDVIQLAKKHKVFPTAVLSMIVYGEIENPLKRPKFVIKR